MSKTANYLVDLLAMKFKTAFMAAVVLTFSACAGHKSADNTRLYCKTRP